MSDDEGRAYRQETSERPRFLVEITPVQVTTWRGGGWHQRYYSTVAGAPPPTSVISHPGQSMPDPKAKS
jgi:hypothetical protein